MSQSRNPLEAPSSTSTIMHWLMRIGWTLGFVVLVRTAKSFDLLNQDFESAGIHLFLFNAARSTLVVYMGLVLYQLGQWIQAFRFGTLRGAVPEALLDRIILCTMYGGGVATLFTFAIGLANLYYDGIALLLTLPVVWASSRLIPNIVQKGMPLLKLQMSTLTSYHKSLLTLLFGILSVGIALTLILKGLWPGDAGPAGGDVYQHYLPYYREVIANHGLSPNSLWYHYYVSKGAGLFFFSMLLSDEMAPQLVTLCFQLLYAAIICDLTAKLTRSRYFGILASITLIYVYLPDHYWGQFMKHHEIMAAWILFAVWLLTYLGRVRQVHWSHYAAGAILFSCAFSIQFPTASALIAPLFCLAAIWYYLTKRKQAAFIAAMHAMAIIVGIGALLAYNQWQSGLAMDTPFRLFWRLANVSKFSEWASPYLVLYLDEGSSKGVGEFISPLQRLTNFGWLWDLLRFNDLNFINPKVQCTIIASSVLLTHHWLARQTRMQKNERAALLVASFGLACLAGAIFKISSSDTATFLAICMMASFYISISYLYSKSLRSFRIHWNDSALFLLVLVVLAWVVANIVDQPVSIHRMFSFLTSITIIAFFYVWLTIVHFIRQYATPSRVIRRTITFVIVLGAALLVAITQIRKIDVRHKLAFSVGLESSLNALNKQGEVWPPYIAARKITGLESPIITFGIQGNIMKTSLAFPGPGLQSEVSYSLGREWHKIAFGSADESEKELRILGINYFLIDWKTQPLFGSVPFSKLFAPEELARRFSMIADFNGIWLIGWKDLGGRLLTANETIIWDLIRAGCVDLENHEAARQALSSNFAVELAAKKFALENPETRSSARVELMKKLDEAVKKTLTSNPLQLSEQTYQSVSRGTIEQLSAELDATPLEVKIFKDTEWGGLHLAIVALHHMNINSKTKLRSQLELVATEAFDDFFAKVVTSTVETQTYRQLFKTVESSFVFNAGVTQKPVIRKPGLPRTKGWQ